MENIKPLRDNILVQLEDRKGETEGGSLLPDCYLIKVKVLAIGPEVTSVDKGDTLVVSGYLVCKITGTNIGFLPETSIYGVVK